MNDWAHLWGELKDRGGPQTEFCSPPMFGGWVEEEEPVRKEKPSRKQLRQESILMRTEWSSERQLESPVNRRVEKKSSLCLVPWKLGAKKWCERNLDWSRQKNDSKDSSYHLC